MQTLFLGWLVFCSWSNYIVFSLCSMIIQYHEHLKWERVCVRCFLSISTPILPTTLKTNGSSLKNWWLVQIILNFPFNFGPFSGDLREFFGASIRVFPNQPVRQLPLKSWFIFAHPKIWFFFYTKKIAEVSSYTMISISLMLQLGCFCLFLWKFWRKKRIKQKTAQALTLGEFWETEGIAKFLVLSLRRQNLTIQYQGDVRLMRRHMFISYSTGSVQYNKQLTCQIARR